MLTAADLERDCAANYLGLWCVEPTWLRQAVAAVKEGTWPRMAVPAVPVSDSRERPTGGGRTLYPVDGGVAHIAMFGPMQKGDSSFGGTVNTVRVRRAIRDAVANADVSSILLSIDSPGGTVAGTQDLADDVRAAATQKPVHAYVEDMAASAALWVASQASRVAANRTALVGSIGTILVVEDTSQAAAAAGVEVHVVATGAYKGAGVEGAPVTPEHLEYFRGIVDGLNEHFVAAVAEGRRRDVAAIRGVADGRVMSAQEARRAGLIDAVESRDAAVEELRANGRRRRARASRARALNHYRLARPGQMG
jgi:signal peptide peptidase SppA